jgi:hypothetical protein
MVSDTLRIYFSIPAGQTTLASAISKRFDPQPIVALHLISFS